MRAFYALASWSAILLALLSSVATVEANPKVVFVHGLLGFGPTKLFGIGVS